MRVKVNPLVMSAIVLMGGHLVGGHLVGGHLVGVYLLVGVAPLASHLAQSLLRMV